jgi:RNA polymerase sigma factor (TIGR02999 family)
MMASPSDQEITQLLLAWSDGDEAALEQLTPLVYAELHRLARGYMCGERSSHTLQTTALVNEAYLRLLDWKNVRWQNRAHFFGVAAQLMRRVLVDYARTRHYAKRGGVAQQVSFDGAVVVLETNLEEIIAVDEALTRLAGFDLRKCRIVELRYFGGLSVKEVVEALKLSQRTVERELSLALAWLYRELRGRDDA